MNLDDILTIKQAAEWLQLSERDFMKKVRAGLIPCIRFNQRSIRFHPRTVLARLSPGMDRTPRLQPVAGGRRPSLARRFSQ